MSLSGPWPRVAPFACLIAFLALDPLLAGILGPWSYGARALLTAIVLMACWPRLTELRPDRALTASLIVLALAVGLGCFVLWISLGPLWRVGSVPAATVPPWPAQPWAANLWIGLRLFGAVLVVPLVEEVFWRSFLARRLDRADFLSLPPAMLSYFAVAASSFVFALAHREVLAAWLTGVAYALLYRRTQDLRLAVLAHAVTNCALGLYVLRTGRFDFW